MTALTPEDAFSLLLAGGNADLEISAGAYVHVDVQEVNGRRATVTAPRLSVASGMRLTGRVIGPDGRPWEIAITIDNASYHSPDLALVRLRAVSAEIDTTRRTAERVPIGGVVWLEAVNCRDIVDGDRVDGTLEDLSKSGVAFSTRRVLRIGDRLEFHGRFFADEITGEVRVASVRPATTPGHTIVGARFLNLDTESEIRIDRILSGGRSHPETPRTTVDLGSLREAAAGSIEPPDEDGPGWRKMFRRS